jgi:hypothetical protein
MSRYLGCTKILDASTTWFKITQVMPLSFLHLHLLALLIG